MKDLNQLFHEQFKVLPSLGELKRWFRELYNQQAIEENPVSLGYDYWVIENNHQNNMDGPLDLGMFVPAKGGKWLEEPQNYTAWLKKKLNTPYNANLYLYEEYQEALQKVIFPGYEVEEECENYIMFKDRCDVWDKVNNTIMQEHLSIICGEPKHKLSDMVGEKINENFKIV